MIKSTGLNEIGHCSVRKRTLLNCLLQYYVGRTNRKLPVGGGPAVSAQWHWHSTKQNENDPTIVFTWCILYAYRTIERRPKIEKASNCCLGVVCIVRSSTTRDHLFRECHNSTMHIIMQMWYNLILLIEKSSVLVHVDEVGAPPPQLAIQCVNPFKCKWSQ